MATAIALLVCALPAAAAPALDAGMNGTYRCADGTTVELQVLAAPLLKPELLILNEAEGSVGTGPRPGMVRHRMAGNDLYGAQVRLGDVQHRLLLSDGLLLSDERKRVVWQFGTTEAPWSGSLSVDGKTVGERCVLEPSQGNH